MGSKIALAGNPNSGKTTLFNALTGSNQFVGNWPGVTVEKKEGKLKGNKEIIITDLPGIYSLSPYTLEEVVARNYLINEQPDAILNIIDGTNLERNLYLTTQLAELGIPMVVAVNMMDAVEKNGDKINFENLSKSLGCPVCGISAIKGEGIEKAAQLAVKAAQSIETFTSRHTFSKAVEQAITHIQEVLADETEPSRQRWTAVKIFERDEKVLEQLKMSGDVNARIEKEIAQAEREMDDDSESIITNERYNYISYIIKDCLVKKNREAISVSDKIDKIVTNRILGLPIFIVVMFAVYYISMVSVGSAATDWANDGLFGDGWHLFSIGSSDYEQACEEYGDSPAVIEAFIEEADLQGKDVSSIEAAIDSESEDFSKENAALQLAALQDMFTEDVQVAYAIEDEETLETFECTADLAMLGEAAAVFEKYGCREPDASEYGIWVPGIPALIESGLDKAGCTDWLKGLILDGIVAGVGAVLGFVPQMFVLFILLAILESCGYMARIAFILDRIFRKFGLSGKSFIPILIGTGCGIPGIMASRTIENERDRRMTVITTTFIPCGAKTPFIAMIAGAIFGGSAIVATGAYFIGMAAIILSGIILKKTRMFAGDPAPFVMELPSYHLPSPGGVLRSMWERGWSFIKKAGTVILLSTIVIWFLTYFGFVDGNFQMLQEDQLDLSLLAKVGNAIAWIFAPLGWGNWQSAVAAVTGLVAKENIVGTMGILYSVEGSTVYASLAQSFVPLAGFSFLVFNLLCAPCFAAMGAIKREMNSGKWTAFAISYQCLFAYAASLCIYQIGALFSDSVSVNPIGLVAALIVLAVFVYLLIRPYKESHMLKIKAEVNA